MKQSPDATAIRRRGDDLAKTTETSSKLEDTGTAQSAWLDVVTTITVITESAEDGRMFRKMILWPPEFGTGRPPAPPRGGFVLQGFLVILSNPKVLLVFGAFIPQFVDPARGTALQVLLLGRTFLVVGSITDSIYALLLGRAGRYLSQKRVRLMSRVSGCFLIGGAFWLALKR